MVAKKRKSTQKKSERSKSRSGSSSRTKKSASQSDAIKRSSKSAASKRANSKKSSSKSPSGSSRPKKDFIVQGPLNFTKDNSPDFIEKENRTTIAGIVAIVIVVFIVAAFLRVQKMDFSLPDNDVRGAATFVGTRYISLAPVELLQGRLNVQGVGDRTFLVDESVVTILREELYSQSLMDYDTNRELYVASYYEGDRLVDLTVDPESYLLTVQGITGTDLELPVSLVPLTVYAGEVSVAGERISLRLIGSEIAFTTNSGVDYVSLSSTENGLLTGSWDWKGESHEVVVNPADKLVTVHNLY